MLLFFNFKMEYIYICVFVYLLIFVIEFFIFLVFDITVWMTEWIFWIVWIVLLIKSRLMNKVSHEFSKTLNSCS